MNFDLMTFTCKNSKTYVISDIWGHMNERFVQESRGDQVVIDLNICMATTHANLISIHFKLLFFHTFQLWTFFFLCFFFHSPFLLFFNFSKINSRQFSFWDLFMHNYQEEWQKKKIYVNGLNITKSDMRVKHVKGVKNSNSSH